MRGFVSVDTKPIVPRLIYINTCYEYGQYKGGLSRHPLMRGGPEYTLVVLYSLLMLFNCVTYPTAADSIKQGAVRSEMSKYKQAN